MEHTCQDCDHVFNEEGSDGPHIVPAVQCPRCHSYRTQPSGIPDESNDMLHGNMGMPDSTMDDMSGNPLQEGFMNDWKDRQVRDESFGGGTFSHRISLFETPEFETTEVIEPSGLGAAHQTTIQIPKGITDNLHATLGNLGAWVESPHENGQLRPYSNKYWKSIRPQFMTPGSLRIGVTDPIMAEIINHVAQTDDLTPLQEYRGHMAKTAGPLMALAPLFPEIGAGAAEVGGAAAAEGAGAAAVDAGAADAAASAGASEMAGGAAGEGAAATGDVGGGGVSTDPADIAPDAGGTGGIMKRLLKAPGLAGMAVHGLDDLLGMGGGGQQLPNFQVQPESFYAKTGSDEDDASPASHDEAPKNEDGDSKQKDDGNNHEWQRDISVNGVGGTDHMPSFDPAGPAMTRFMMMAPLLLQYLDSGEDASQDPLIHGLHQSLESEVPGYLDHADDNAGQRLVMVIRKQHQPKAEATHTDENSGGKKESKVASLRGQAAEFLPDLEVEAPHLRGAALYDNPPYQYNSPPPGAMADQGVMLDPEYEQWVNQWPKNSPTEKCPHCNALVKAVYGTCPQCRGEIYPHGEGQAQGMEYLPKYADTQGPQTPEQIQAVQQWLIQHGAEMGLEGEELMQTILSVPTNPLEFADILANITQSEPPPPPPPASPQQGGMSPNPPMPPQEAAPPQATMPMPGMGMQGMVAAVQKYAADSIADECPACGSHTTELLSDEDGTSRCHACNNVFKTDKGVADKVHPGQTTASTLWNVDEDFRKEADFDHSHEVDPTQVGGHTWLDEGGSPLKVGQEYEMYSSRYDIPDLVRIEAVKPDSIVYTLTGEFGLEHSTELTKEEAKIEGTSFRTTEQPTGPEDDGSLEMNNDDNTGYTEPGARDLSQPDSVVSSASEYNPRLAWLMEGVKTSGATYTPMEQRALIEESGIARNADMLDLVGTHYITDEGDGHDQFAFGW